MLISNNIIESKDIVIDVKKQEVYIGNCDVIVKIKIKFSKSIICLVYLRRIIIIFSRTKMSLVVHYFDVLEDRDFLFELKNNIILTLYVEIINVSIKAIIARNNSNKTIQISRNYRLDYVVGINYSNAFLVNASKNVRNLVI